MTTERWRIQMTMTSMRWLALNLIAQREVRLGTRPSRYVYNRTDKAMGATYGVLNGSVSWVIRTGFAYVPREGRSAPEPKTPVLLTEKGQNALGQLSDQAKGVAPEIAAWLEMMAGGRPASTAKALRLAARMLTEAAEAAWVPVEVP